MTALASSHIKFLVPVNFSRTRLIQYMFIARFMAPSSSSSSFLIAFFCGQAEMPARCPSTLSCPGDYLRLADLERMTSLNIVCIVMFLDDIGDMIYLAACYATLETQDTLLDLSL